MFIVPPKYLIAVPVCIALLLSLIWATGPRAVNNRQKHKNRTHQLEIKSQKIMDQSNTLFQEAEACFRKKSYDESLRKYIQAIDVIIESDIDLHKNQRLKKQFQKLNDYMVRRQLTIRQASYAGALERVINRPTITPLFLDEKIKIRENKERKRAADMLAANAAVAAADFDFMVEPDASIQRFIYYHQHRGRKAMEYGLRRSGRYLHLVRDIFLQEGVPQDLVWMAQVESAWTPNARSHASAVGLWQFIPTTGKRFGLRQNDWIDERMSFEGATRASARYLRWLCDRYHGNWALALAGYNAGESAVDRAIAKNGLPDFWKIYERKLLPRETRNYVPNIIATIIIGKDPEKYGFHVAPDRSLSYETLIAKRSISLHLVADAIDGSIESLLELNPELRHKITPPDMAYVLRIPTGKSGTLRAMLQHIPPNQLSN